MSNNIRTKHKIQLKKILGLILILLFFIGPISQSVIALQEKELLNQTQKPDINSSKYPGWDLEKKIAIIFDRSDLPLTKTAFSVFSSARILYHNIALIPVENFQQVVNLINNVDYDIKSYFIKGSIDGVTLGGKTWSWNKFAKFLTSEKHTHHIFGAGSTDQLLKEIDSTLTNIMNLHIEGSDVIDTELAYFYTLWEIGEIFNHTISEDGANSDYQKVGEDFRNLATIYFAENMNSLINAQINPVEPLGEEDNTTRLENYERKLESFNNLYQILPDGSPLYLNETDVVPQTNIYLYNETEENEGIQIGSELYFQQLQLQNQNLKPVSDLSVLTSHVEPFTIADLPLFSGLEGPTAGIIDAILNVLIKFGGSKVGLDPDVAVQIVNQVKELTVLLSSSSGTGDSKDTLRSLASQLCDIAPIPASLHPFCPLIVDALFLFRGSTQDIVDFIKNMISAIFTTTSSLVNSTTLQSMFQVLETSIIQWSRFDHSIA